MKLSDVLRRCVETGHHHHPRPNRREGEGFGEAGTACPDTRLLHGDPSRDVAGAVLVGIDVGIGEILVADRLRERGEPVGLVVAHRAGCRPCAAPHDLLALRSGLLERFGVPVAVASRVARAAAAEPFAAPERDVDAAALLDIPYLCVRTPADLAAARHLQARFDAEAPATLAGCLALLARIDEYRHAAERHRGPRLVHGLPEDACGRVYVDMNPDAASAGDGYAALRDAGAGCVVALHATAGHADASRAAGLRLVDAGQVASDSLGLNLLLDEVFSHEPVRVVGCSGFRRFPRPTAH